MELILVRHGESTGNVARENAEASGAEVIPVEARDADVPLSPLGVQQAEALGHRLAADASALGPLDAVWCSPYLRARQTTQLALAAGELDAVPRVDERLRDKELGVLDTLTAHGVQVRFPEEAVRRRRLGKFYYRPPCGESWADMVLRLRSVLAEALGEASAQRVLVVAHDATTVLIRYVCERLREDEVLAMAAADPIGNASVTRLSRAVDGSWTAVEVNGQDHLVRPDGTDLRTEHPADTTPPAHDAAVPR